MTAEEVYKRVIRKGRIAPAGYSFDEKFLLDLEEAMNVVSRKAMGLSTGSKITGKEVCIRTYTNVPVGHVGYGGHYKLPTDLVKIDRMEVNTDGKCWRVPTYVDFVDKRCSLHEDECNSCKQCYSECNPEVIIKNKDLTILTPIKVGMPCGIKLWYTPRYAKITKKTDVIELDDLAMDYLIYHIVLINEQVDADKYSNTNNNRLYALYKRAEEAFSSIYEGGRQVKKIRFKNYGLY